MGRIPKLVKERALKELKEQKMKEEAALAEPNEAHSRAASCSSINSKLKSLGRNRLEFIDGDKDSIDGLGSSFSVLDDEN